MPTPTIDRAPIRDALQREHAAGATEAREALSHWAALADKIADTYPDFARILRADVATLRAVLDAVGGAP